MKNNNIPKTLALVGAKKPAMALAAKEKAVKRLRRPCPRAKGCGVAKKGCDPYPERAHESSYTGKKAE